MMDIDEFPHHDAHRYENDRWQAAFVIFLLVVFTAMAAVFFVNMARAI
jgi:hypothetical protein